MSEITENTPNAEATPLGGAEAATEPVVFCPACGYDMRASLGGACPECGLELNEEALRRAQVPWARRREIGRRRALWRTWAGVVFRTRRFGLAVGQPLDLREAKRFRRVVVWVVWCSTVAAAGVLGLLNTDFLLGFFDEGDGFSVGWVAVAAALGWCLLYGWTGVQTYWFHPRALPESRQQRAVVLSYYACAPLLAMPLVLGLIPAGLVIQRVGDELNDPLMETSGLWVVLAGVCGVGLLIAAFLRVALVWTGSVARRGAGGRCLLVVGLPLAWLGLLVLIGGVLPGLTAYAVLMLSTW